MDHSDVNPSLRTFRQRLIVFAKPPVAPQPCKGALNHPSARQYSKFACPRTFDNLNNPAANLISPINRFTSISCISPYKLQARKATCQSLEYQLGAMIVLNVGRMDNYCQQQPHSINDDVELSPCHSLGRIITTNPPFSVVFTLWLSIMAALGVGSLSSISLTLGRNASWIRSHVPSFLHSLKYLHTVPQGGRSWGIMRQVQPPPRTYTMALMTSLISTWRGRPPDLGPGIRSDSCSHWESVKSLGYP